MATSDAPDNTTQSADPVTSSSRAAGMNAEIRTLLFDCASKQAFYQKLLSVCQQQFHATVAQITYHVGDQVHQELQHDSRMANNLAKRFASDYLNRFAEEVQSPGNTDAKMRRYERGNQQMTLIAAPILDHALNRCEGAIVLMLGGGTYKTDVVLPRLDAIVAMASTVLVAKMGVFASATAAESAAPSPAPAEQQTLMANSALAKASQFQSTREFGFSIVNSLCGQLQAEQVFFGIEKQQRIVVEAVSGFPDFKASSPGIATVRQSMEECLDGSGPMLAQHEMPEALRAQPIHQRWSSESNNSCVLSVPLIEGTDVTGVVSIRRPATRPFQMEEIEKLTKTLAPYGAAVRVVEKANRSMGGQLKSSLTATAKKNFGKGAVGRKVMLLALLLGLGWFFFGTLTYRPMCNTRVTAADLRHFAAPFNSKLKAVYVTPGKKVTAGELLAEFDTSDLQLELNSLVRQIATTQVELRQGISDGDMAVAALAKAQLKVLQTQRDAVQKQIQDSRIVAPAAGTVVLSDLEQRVGQVFPQGEDVLQFAPEGEWLLEIEVPDDIVNFVAAEQTGTFAAASSPAEKQTFTIRHVDGAANVVNDRNVFIARAPLESRPDWMRSGMEGMARLETVSRPVWWVTMHRVVDWARVNFWL